MKKSIVSLLCFATLLMTVSAHAKTADCILFEPGAPATDSNQVVTSEPIRVVGKNHSFTLVLGTDEASLLIMNEVKPLRLGAMEFPYDSKIETEQVFKMHIHNGKGYLIAYCSVQGK